MRLTSYHPISEHSGKSGASLNFASFVTSLVSAVMDSLAILLLSASSPC